MDSRDSYRSSLQELLHDGSFNISIKITVLDLLKSIFFVIFVYVFRQSKPISSLSLDVLGTSGVTSEG